MLSSSEIYPHRVQPERPRLSRRLSRRGDQPLPRLRPDPLAHRPDVGRVRLLLNRASAEGGGETGARPTPVFWSGSRPISRAQRGLTVLRISVLSPRRSGVCARGAMKTLFISALALMSASPAVAGASRLHPGQRHFWSLGRFSIRRAGTNDWKPLDCSSGRRRERSGPVQRSRLRVQLSAPRSPGAAPSPGRESICAARKPSF